MAPQWRDDREDVRVFAVRLGGGGIQPARVAVADRAISVEIAGFSVELPRSTTHARRLPDEPHPGGPAYDRQDETRWRYTTDRTGIVELTTDPPVEGWMGVLVARRRIRVGSLRISLVEPDQFVGYLEGGRPATG